MMRGLIPIRDLQTVLQSALMLRKYGLISVLQVRAVRLVVHSDAKTQLQDLGAALLQRPSDGLLRAVSDLEHISNETNGPFPDSANATGKFLMTTEQQTDTIQVGDTVRSYDFPGFSTTEYVEGVVEKIGKISPDCDRYHIRVIRQVAEGEDVKDSPLVGNLVYPPVNGTPNMLGRVCHGVKVLAKAKS